MAYFTRPRLEDQVMGYSCKTTRTAIGTYHEFHGPGLPRHANGLHLVRDCESETVSRLLAAAFEAGRKAKASEILSVLGILK